MIEQGFNNADSIGKEMINFLNRGQKILEPIKDKKKSSTTSSKLNNERKNHKKRQQENSDSSVVELSKESYVEHMPVRKCCILHKKCNHITDNYKDLKVITLKHKKRNKVYKQYLHDKKDSNALIEKNQKFVKNKKRRKTEKEL